MQDASVAGRGQTRYAPRPAPRCHNSDSRLQFALRPGAAMRGWTAATQTSDMGLTGPTGLTARHGSIRALRNLSILVPATGGRSDRGWKGTRLPPASAPFQPHKALQRGTRCRQPVLQAPTATFLLIPGGGMGEKHLPSALLPRGFRRNVRWWKGRQIQSESQLAVSCWDSASLAEPGMTTGQLTTLRP